MINYKYIVVIAISLITLLLTSCGSSLNPTKLARNTQSTVEDIKAYNGNVFDEIQKNIDMVTKLKENMSTVSENEQPPTIKEVIKDIESVTKSYENLANRKTEILNTFKNKIAVIERMQKNVDTEIKSLHSKSNEYNKQLNSLSTTTSDPETLRTRKRALTKAIEYVNNQIILWQQFAGLESNIKDEMVNVQKRIDNFLSMIDSSAILFREGLNLLKLQQDLDEALSLFTIDLPEMERLSQEMENSWSDLDFLVNSLTTLTVQIK